MKATTTNKKTLIGVAAALVVIAALIVSFGFNSTRGRITVSGKIPVSKLQGSFSINFNNINDLVGDADYVFVGTVISEDGTEYKHPVMGEAADGKEYEIASPYTNYTISVLYNIKGELVTDTEIPIQKSGGLAQDGSQYFIYEQDELLEQGSVYIIYAYAQSDGSLLVSGPNSNEKINVTAKAVTDDPTGTLETISAVQEVIDALDTQVETGRMRFVSTYDANQ